jgi:glycosyltransferase involved in cell wall biosynthesis
VAGKNPAFRRMAKLAFDTAGLVTANAESLRDVAVDDLGADPNRFELIAYGVDPNALRPDPSGTAELRATLGIPAEAVVLLAVGRMVYKKGFDSVLRAAALLGEAYGGPPLHLVMVGEGDLWQEWQALAAMLGLGERVHWVGAIPANRMSVYYNTADVAVMPAANRPPTGLAVAVLDAMSCAIPVIGSDAAGNRLAIRDGVNGFITPEGDDKALAEAIRALACDPALRSRMGAAGRRLIDTELGWPQLAARYAVHFERLRRERRA